MVDSKGLITTSRGDKLPEHKKQMARSDDTPNMKDLAEIIAYVKPHALIGLSGAGPSFEQVRLRRDTAGLLWLTARRERMSIQASMQKVQLYQSLSSSHIASFFSPWNEQSPWLCGHEIERGSCCGAQNAIEEMCKHVQKPLVFPLSNPTDKAEITAEHAYQWSHGQAIFASGAPAFSQPRRINIAQNARSSVPAQGADLVWTEFRVSKSPWSDPRVSAPGGCCIHCAAGQL